MKVLLLGEFSGVHLQLRDALRSMGIHAFVASTGDYWKEINGDIRLPRTTGSLLNRARAAPQLFSNVREMRGFDVVQLIYPTVFPFLNSRFVRQIATQNGALFLVGAGSDSVTNVFLRDLYSRPGLYEAMKLESGGRLYVEKPEVMRFEAWLRKEISGYIPLMYEYAQGYRNVAYPKLRSTIPIPINTGEISYSDNVPGRRVVFFHGINRPLEKGTPLVKQAMENVRRRYPRDVEIVMEGKMPLREYLSALERSNVVIDQTYAVSYGVNAVYAMAMGRICMGGGDTQESRSEFDVDWCPMVAIEPTIIDIERKIIDVLERRSEFPEWGYKSRRYVQQVHEADAIAHRFVREWARV